MCSCEAVSIYRYIHIFKYFDIYGKKIQVQIECPIIAVNLLSIFLFTEMMT